MFKFREPSFVEYLMWDVERFHEKGRRERFVIAMQFLDGTPQLDALMLADADRLIRQFSDFLAGKHKVVHLSV